MPEEILIPTIEGAPVITALQKEVELAIREFTVSEQKRIMIVGEFLDKFKEGEPLLIKASELIGAVGDGEPTPEQAKETYTLRRALAEVRNRSSDIKDAGKKEVLEIGRIYDKTFGIIRDRTSTEEKALKEIEEYAERKEAARIEALGSARREELEKFGCLKDPKIIAQWDEDTYQAVLIVERQKYEARIKAEAEEAERVAEADKQEKERIARITLGNTRIHDAGKEGVIIPIPAIEAGAMEAAEWLTYFGNLYLQKQEVDRIAAEEKAAKDAEIARLEAERKAAEAKAQAEREAAAKLFAEQQASAKAEANRIAEEQRKKDLEAQRVLEAQQAEARAAREAAAKLQAEADARAKAEREAAETLAKAGDAEKLAIIQAKIKALADEIKAMTFTSDAGILTKEEILKPLRTAYAAAKI